MKTKNLNRQTARSEGLLQDIRVISFDVGFTLIYPDPPVGKAYADIAARFGYRLDANETHTRFKESWTRKTANNRSYKNGNALANEALSYQWWKEIFKEATGDILKPGDLENIFNVCYDEYANGSYWALYPDVEQTLAALRAKGSRLVVLSNWDNRLNRTLEDLQLTHYFEKIYISTRIGYAKPNPGAFQHIIDDLKIPGREILHVGDTLEDDGIGARQAGLRSVCIDRRGRYDPAAGPIPIISSLTELLN